MKTNGEPIATVTDALPSLDTLNNMVSGMGTGLDKNQHSFFTSRGGLQRSEVRAMYRHDWLAAKIVDVPASDMTRKWRTFSDVDAAKLKEINKAEKRIGLKNKVNKAIKLARKTGGAGIFLGVEGQGSPDTPLDPEKVKQGQLKYILVLSSYKLQSYGRINTDLFSPNYGKPDAYRVGSQVVHHSRVVRFEGVDVDDEEHSNRGWGASVLERPYQVVKAIATAYSAIGSMLHESTLDIFNIQGLYNMVGNCEVEKRVMRRFTLHNLAKSIHKAVLLGENESYQRQTTSFTGVKEAAEVLEKAAAGAADIPLTRLYGVSPGGLNATGESDLINYYDSISSSQENDLRPALELFDGVFFRSTFGEEPPEFKFSPLWQMSEEQRAKVDKMIIEAAVAADGVFPDVSVARYVTARGVLEIPQDYVKQLEEDYTPDGGEEETD